MQRTILSTSPCGKVTSTYQKKITWRKYLRNFLRSSKQPTVINQVLISYSTILQYTYNDSILVLGYLTFSEFQQLMIKVDLGISVQEMRFIISEADSNETGIVDYHEFVPLAVDLVQVSLFTLYHYGHVMYWYNLLHQLFSLLERVTRRKISAAKRITCSTNKYWRRYHTKTFREPLTCASKKFRRSISNATASFALPTWRSVWWHSLDKLVFLRVKSSCWVRWFPKISSVAADTMPRARPFSTRWARCASWRWRTLSWNRGLPDCRST